MFVFSAKVFQSPSFPSPPFLDKNSRSNLPVINAYISVVHTKAIPRKLSQKKWLLCTLTSLGHYLRLLLSLLCIPRRLLTSSILWAE